MPSTISFDYRLPRWCRFFSQQKSFTFVLPTPPSSSREVSDVAQFMQTEATFFDLTLLEFIASFAKPFGTYIDCGAHLGSHSVFFKAWLADEVIAVEPNPYLCTLIQENIHQNKLPATDVVQAGLSDHESRMALIVPQDSKQEAGPNLAHAQLSMTPSPADFVIGSVPVTSLDTLLSTRSTRPVTLIKIDVENHEAAVLRGAKHVLATDKPDLVIEIWTPEKKQKIDHFLSQWGYKSIAKFGKNSPSYYYKALSSNPLIAHYQYTRYGLKRVLRKLIKTAVS